MRCRARYGSALAHSEPSAVPIRPINQPANLRAMTQHDQDAAKTHGAQSAETQPEAGHSEASKPEGVRPELVSALFTEQIDFRQVAGGSTRIDLTGVYFSVPVSGFPASLEPHLVTLIRAPQGCDGNVSLTVDFVDEAGEQIASSRQDFFVEPGRFGYRLIKGSLSWDGPGTIEARCSIAGSNQVITVPLSAVVAQTGYQAPAPPTAPPAP